jgi:L,D-transpeptidase YbiS
MKVFIIVIALGLVYGRGEASEVASLQQEHRRLLQAVKPVADKPYIVINTQDNRLLLRDPVAVWKEAVCATGNGRKLEGEGTKSYYKWKFDTPKGRFSILRKVEDPLWIKPVWHFIESEEEIPIFAEDPRRFQRGVLGTFALYFLKDFMIHGTLYEINLGKSITHGCVRVGAEDLHYLYDTVEKGWSVYIY